MVFDLSIPFLLAWRRTRLLAYGAVLVFHGMTAMLFNIGMFPLIMVACTPVFFTQEEWLRGWQRLRRAQGILVTTPIRLVGAGLAPARGRGEHDGRPRGSPLQDASTPAQWPFPMRLEAWIVPVFLLFQVLMPLRHWAYPGDVHWTEEGFRFSWKVMVMEKTGSVVFNLTDPASGRTWSAYPGDYLTPFQEQQMSFQPDMILEFARHLAEEQRQPGMAPLEVRAEVYVSLNGRASRLLIDPTVDLASIQDSLRPKTWIVHGS